jgi:glycosyltransferase involved in cell wall biosynthesis
VSVITPSFQQGAYLEETIRSVLLQGYPNLDYIVIDGGSTDGSRAILERYAPWLSAWVSEADRGQVEAINKGLRRASGEIWGWLNSDDFFQPGCLGRAVPALIRQPAAGFVYGSARFCDENGGDLGPYAGLPLAAGSARMRYWRGWPLPQPGSLYRQQLLRDLGPLDESLHLALDYEWAIRVTQTAPGVCLDETLASYRLHTHSKTGDWNANRRRFYAECRRVNLKYAPPYQPRHWRLWLTYVADHLRWRAQSLLRPRA